MTDQCGKRQPTGLDICTLPPHSNKTRHKDEATGREWGGRKPNPLIKRTGIKQVSDKGEARNAWLQAILYGKLVEQGDHWPHHPYWCETCGTQVSSDIEEALSILQPGHIEERRHDPGQGVRFGSGGKVTRIGTDSWENVIPQCPPCNKKQHVAERSEPEFSKGVYPDESPKLRDIGGGPHALEITE